MPDSQNDILKRLSQHEEKPPEFLFEKILVEVRHGHKENSWQDLKDHSFTPPPELYQHIRQKWMQERSQKRSPVFFIRKYRAIAAILLAGMLAVAIYMLLPGKRAVEPLAEKKPAPAGQSIDSARKSDSATLNAKADTLSRQVNRKKRSVPAWHSSGTQQIPFVNNDLLSSLMECTNCNFAAYFTEKKRIILDIDQYSAVAISDKMRLFMQALYTTNRRGKSTHKSRKTKRILVRWQKADAAYFDNESSRTALDPLDLTEFLINNNKK
ncbi:MAG TPA: hypothetical protein VHN59_13890 [Chitinophagaceae bacterium]|nr:hypothetical protein [Chitinophagaceae bacterium]